MSLVYITHHDENIFNVELGITEFKPDLVKTPSKAIPRTSGKSSSFLRNLRQQLNVDLRGQQMVLLNDGTRVLTTAKKGDHQSMGCAKVPIDPPCAYLRKNGGVKWRREHDHVCPKGIRDVPPVPTRPPKAQKKTMFPNFVERNKQCALEMVPCTTPPRYVDQPNGTSHNVLNSGLIPQYICRKDFAKVPTYLKRTKKMLAEQHERCMQEEARLNELCGGKTLVKMAGMRTMGEEERNKILEGLKQHLSEMTKQYQSMSLLTDTIAKRTRKGKLESDLRQVEQDIVLIETSPIIYVSQY